MTTPRSDISARLRTRADILHPDPLPVSAANLMHEAATMLDIRPASHEHHWQRGDLVLVDGDKEGCVLSVNGNVAQVSMWAASAAVVNLARLSPLEGIEWDHNAGPKNSVDERVEIDGARSLSQVVLAIGAAGLAAEHDCIDATPAIRCTPEVGIVVQTADGPVLTIDPLDGGDCPTVNMGDVERWMQAHRDRKHAAVLAAMKQAREGMASQRVGDTVSWADVPDRALVKVHRDERDGWYFRHGDAGWIVGHRTWNGVRFIAIPPLGNGWPRWADFVQSPATIVALGLTGDETEEQLRTLAGVAA